ncbi:hypothetical protein BK004_04655 [bacterium CG10_46_32]|nr:MAG: hypothetical protein BK004_04655 [bacterium CG10_46_32]PIR55733.1 MAG: hypothetical protein COU73_04695 [Parcubacteria group bacterium CG10_big_fil_rev_8_21_14_0_10_46_32]
MLAGLLLCCALAIPVWAAERTTSVSMFGSWVNEDTYGEESEFGDLQPLTAWSIIDCRINSRTHLVGVFATDDQDKVVRLRDFRFHWKPKQKMHWLAPWLLEFTGGYFVPPFAREWSVLNPFQVGTVKYSGISDSLVARDNGVQLKLVPLRQFSVTVAMFAADRKGGYTGEWQDNTHRHFYFQTRRPVVYGFVAGASYRFTTRDRTPWALELTRESEQSLYAFELLREDDGDDRDYASQWYVLAERDIRHQTPKQGGNIRLVARFEELRYGQRYVLGCALFLVDGLTVKANYALERFPGERNQKLFLQGIAHFDFSS